MFIAACAVAALGSPAAAADASAVDPSDLPGEGTAEDPYRISNASELQAISQDLDANYRLSDTVDAAETATWNAGAGFGPIGSPSDPFTGSFDGNGYWIWDLEIDRPTESGVGLFGHVGPAGTVENVTLSNVSVTGEGTVGSLVGTNDGLVVRSGANGTVTGSTTNVGGLVGATTSLGRIEESFGAARVDGTGGSVGGLVGRLDGDVTQTIAIRSVAGDRRVGGLVGEHQGTVERSMALANVSGHSSTVGGLVGVQRTGFVDRAYARGDVEGGAEVGGLVGRAAGGTIRQTYAVGNVTASAGSAGGLAARNDGASVELSYWDTNTTGRSTSAGGTGLTTDEMLDAAATGNMSFRWSSGWAPGFDDYPYLLWEQSDVRVLELRPLQESVTAGEPAKFTLLLRNRGASALAFDVPVDVDGDHVTQHGVTVDPMIPARSVFEVATGGLDPGEHDVEVHTGSGASATFEVEGSDDGASWWTTYVDSGQVTDELLGQAISDWNAGALTDGELGTLIGWWNGGVPENPDPDL